MSIGSTIEKLRNKIKINYNEIDELFTGYLNKKVTDEQMTEVLKLICQNGLTKQETYHLCDVFIKSGKILDLSSIGHITVDKHSTGGIGDKTTMILGPIIACSGLYMPKMSGRSLGITGGTIDKLESIKGFNVNLDNEFFLKQVKEIGFAITSQNKDLVPLDKVIYALRDVTGTTNSIHLIAVSIMSKKIATNTDIILLDIKYGKGALVKTKKEAKNLAKLMTYLGKMYHKKTKYILSDMNSPLGNNIGNALEVVEAINVLKGNVNNDLTKLSIKLSTTLISLGKKISKRKAKKEVLEIIRSGQAYRKFEEFIKYQNGDLTALKICSEKQEVRSSEKGIIKSVDALKVGELMLKVKAGRTKKNEPLDYTTGIILHKKENDPVEINDLLATIYTEDHIKEDVSTYFIFK